MVTPAMGGCWEDKKTQAWCVPGLSSACYTEPDEFPDCYDTPLWQKDTWVTGSNLRNIDPFLQKVLLLAKMKNASQSTKRP